MSNRFKTLYMKRLGLSFPLFIIIIIIIISIIIIMFIIIIITNNLFSNDQINRIHNHSIYVKT